MKLCIALVVLTLAAVAYAGKKKFECGGNGRIVRQFSDRKENTKMPCKYHALRQQCGKFLVTLTPGNVYLHNKYRLDSLWLGVTLLTGHGGQWWSARTDNKIAVKFMNGWTSELFHYKGGNLAIDNQVEFGKDDKGTWAKAKDGSFRVSFTPWDPDSKKFTMSSWNFECSVKKEDFQPTGYPKQICGGDDASEVADRNEALGFEGRDQVIYYDVFTDTNVAQTNSKCANATRLMTRVCTEQQRRDAIITCSQILSSAKHTKCATKYSCDPMDVFVDCIDWVCSDYQDRHSCERVGKAIDMCRTFNRGDLSKKVEDANCFKDFLPILKQ